MRIPEGSRIVTRPQPPPLVDFPAPELPMPAASGTTLPAVGQRWPASQTTDFSFLYSGLQASVQPGSANVFTAAQTFTAPPVVTTTDTGGGADVDALRPAHLTLTHLTTLPTVAGTGTSIFHQVNDVGGNLVRIGKEVAEITSTVVGAVSSSLTWCAMQAGQECETFRVQGARGPTAIIDPNGGSTAGGAAAGYVGGRVLFRGDTYHLGTTAVNNAPLRMVTHQAQLTTGTVQAGLGVEQYWEGKDASNNLVPLARQQVLITGPTAGAVHSAQIWTVSYNSAECEVVRIRGGAGMTPTVGASFVPGGIGGECWVRADLKHSGVNLGFYNVTTVPQPTGGAATAGATYTSVEMGMLNRVYVGLRALGLLS